MKINMSEGDSRRLETYEGMLPSLIESIIDSKRRNSFLISIGRYDEKMSLSLKRKQKIKTSNNWVELELKELKEWLIKNPEYKHILEE